MISFQNLRVVVVVVGCGALVLSRVCLALAQGFPVEIPNEFFFLLLVVLWAWATSAYTEHCSTSGTLLPRR